MDELSSKYQKLALEYAKLKAQNQVLRKGVKDEKEHAAQIQNEFQTCDQTVRRLQQEIDSSNFRSMQMAKRVELLQGELERAKRTKSKNDNERLPSALSTVLDEDLKNKIEENEILHKRVDQAETKVTQLENDLRRQLTTEKELNATLIESMETLKQNSMKDLGQITEEKNCLEKQVLQSEVDLQKAQSNLQQRLSYMTSQNINLQSKLNVLEKFFDNWEMFNDHAIEEYVLTKVLPFQKRNQFAAEIMAKQVVDLLIDLHKCFGNFHKYSKMRCLLYPVDSSFQPVTHINQQLAEHLDDSELHVNTMIKLLKNDLQICPYPISFTTIGGLKNLCQKFSDYAAFWTKLFPYYMQGLREECALSVCAPALQLKNTEYTSQFQKILPAISKLHVYSSIIPMCGSVVSKVALGNVKVIVGKITSVFSDLHLIFKDMSKTFNVKMVLEYQMPTTTKSQKLKLSNELFMSSLVSLSNVCGKLSGYLTENLAPFVTESLDASLSPFILMQTHKQTTAFLSSTAVSSPPLTVDYATALKNQYHTTNKDKQELLKKLETITSKLHFMEQEKEHWLLETQLLKMKLEKQAHAMTVGLTEEEISAFTSDRPGTSEGCSSTEDLIKQHMATRISDCVQKVKYAEAKSIHFESECLSLHKHLAMLNKKKQAVQEDLDKSVQAVSQLHDELAITRRNYEDQLSLMSEHLAAMNDKLAGQKDEINLLKNVKHRKR